MIPTSFNDRLQEAAARREYATYRRVRDGVIRMLEAEQRDTGEPSQFWSAELGAFEYMLDASPLIVSRLREHCYHLTGVRTFEYRHPAGLAARLRRAMLRLRALDRRDLFVPESLALGGFGYQIDGHLVNVDTLRYYEALIALDRAGQLSAFNGGDRRRVVLEIGAGWGGFAYQFMTRFPNTTYIVIDLPQTLLFSATYLQCVFPASRTHLYGDGTAWWDRLPELDFVFLPHFQLEEVRHRRPPIDLAVNMASFQEMTERQVEEYVSTLADSGCRALFTANREHSPHNLELHRLEPILARHYQIREIDMPRIAVDVAGSLLARLRYWGRSPHAYRYLLGSSENRIGGFAAASPARA